jgi:hypothetical protein
VIRYLQGTIDLTLTLSGEASRYIKWWIDASFANHVDMKGHSGGTMSIANGCIYITSVKQKRVTRSSTESEVVGVYNVLPQAIWTMNFIKEQGFCDYKTKIYQDNKSAILLEVNGRQSSIKRTCNMNLRYFFINDFIKNGDISEHCDTNNMLADYFTKPLQGKTFLKLRDDKMNIDPNDKYHANYRSVL